MHIEIHAIDRDNGTGQYVRRHAFHAPDRETANHGHPELPGLITHQDTYAGQVAVVEAPEGCTFGTTGSGDGVLITPDGKTFSADEVLSSARASRSWHRMGFSIARNA